MPQPQPPFSGCLWGTGQSAFSLSSTGEAGRGEAGGAELTCARGEHYLCSQAAAGRSGETEPTFRDGRQRYIKAPQERLCRICFDQEMSRYWRKGPVLQGPGGSHRNFFAASLAFSLSSSRAESIFVLFYSIYCSSWCSNKTDFLRCWCTCFSNRSWYFLLKPHVGFRSATVRKELKT